MRTASARCNGASLLHHRYTVSVFLQVTFESFRSSVLRFCRQIVSSCSIVSPTSTATLAELRFEMVLLHSPSGLCRQRPAAGRREDARRGGREDTGRISRFCKGRNTGSPPRHCDRCRSVCPRADCPCHRSIASCLSVAPDCGPPVGLSSDGRIPCMRRNIKPETG